MIFVVLIKQGGRAVELESAIYARRAVRDFTSTAIEKTVLQRLIDAAVQAPSAVNEQSWSFTVVQDRAVLRAVSKAAKAHVLQNPPAGVPQQHVQELLSDPDFDIFYGAPALIVISSVTNGAWAIENCALAAENLMLAACNAGLGTCWIGFAQSWLGTPPGKASIRLPSSYLPVAPIIVGHPKSPPPPVPRKVPEIHWIGP